MWCGPCTGNEGWERFVVSSGKEPSEITDERAIQYLRDNIKEGK